MRAIVLGTLLLAIASPLLAQTPSPDASPGLDVDDAARPPIVETHLHVGAIRSPAHRDSVLNRLDEHGVSLALLSIFDTAGARWSDVAPERIWVGAGFPCYAGRYPGGGACFASTNGWPDLAWLRRQFESGRMRFMGELFYVYYGIMPDDPRLEPYWALAEEFDVPVAVHIGRRPESTLPEGCCPEYDDDYGDPALLEPVLARHPGLRIWLMHAPGSPEWIGSSIALMQAHPTVYADMSIMNSVLPPPIHAFALRAFLDAGLGDRIVFGSDNADMAQIIERMESVPFLTDQQRRAIYCGNAVTFLRASADACAVP